VLTGTVVRWYCTGMLSAHGHHSSTLSQFLYFGRPSNSAPLLHLKPICGLGFIRTHETSLFNDSDLACLAPYGPVMEAR
jgi:hypothetical protein